MADVEVEFLPGSRRGFPVATGYIVQVAFTEAGVEHDCVFDFRSSEHAIERDGDLWLPLGVRSSALMGPLDAERMRSVVVPGAGFEVFEGSYQVGFGRVVTAPTKRNQPPDDLA